jgi:tetratricopeptide (TPR) repeat protein
MKAEERQELEKSDLEDFLARSWAFLQKYATHILLIVALVILGFQLYRWYERSQLQKLHEAWTILNDAPNATNPPGRYKNIIADYHMPEVQALAYAGLGDFYSEVITFGAVPPQYQGVTLTVPEAADQAKMAYEQVLTQFPDQALAVVRARFGLGKLAESNGDFAKSKELYQQIAEHHADDAFGAYAKYRMDNLARWSTPVIVAKPETATQADTQAATQASSQAIGTPTPAPQHEPAATSQPTTGPRP